MMNTDFLSVLNIGSLIKIKDSSWNGRDFVELDKMLTTDINVINYRLDALTDLMENDVLFEAVKEILPQLVVLQETRAMVGSEGEDIDNLFAIRDLQIYVNLIDFLNEKLGASKINSEMFLKLKEGVAEIAEDESFERTKAAIPENTQLISDMKSVTIGVNLDSGLHPAEAGIVSVNNCKFASGSIIDKVLRLDMSDNPYQCSAPLVSPSNLLTGRDEKRVFETALNTALYKLVRSSIRSWKPAVRTYTYAKTSFILSFYSDLRFLYAAAVFYRKLKEMRYPVCRPNVRPMEERKCVIRGMYYPQMVLDGLFMTENDFICDDKGMLYIMSGANSGGKTVYGKSAAVCQALFQMGLFVPAESAELSPASEILLHFSALGTNPAQSRFTEECEKMSRLMHLADNYSFIVCDESFSGTSAFEAAAISEEVIKAMSAKGCRGIFITHIHELSSLPEKINGLDVCVSPIDNLTVKIDHSDGKRLYIIAREKTTGSSYASDIAEKYGLSFEKLMEPDS